MTKNYSLSSSTLSLTPLGDISLMAIGRIIRAYAEIEDIGTMFLSALIGLNEAKSLVVFGRMTFSAKLKLMAKFAKMTGEDAVHTYSVCFDTLTFHSITACRNAVAHGVYCGVTEQGEYAFRLSAAIASIEGTKIAFDVTSFSSEVFSNVANLAEQGARELEQILGFKEARETRFAQGLFPHSKARPKVT